MVAITSSLSSSSSYLSLPHLLCPPPFLSLFSLLLKPPRSALLPHAPPLLRLSVPKPSLSLTSIRPIHCLSQSLQPAPETEIDHEFEPESEDEEGLETGEVVKLPRRDWGKLPSLSGKEKKEIASYARSLGKKLKAQSVGKSGVTEAVGIAMVESLEKNELLKIKIHNNCPDELDDAVKQLEKLTGSVVVGQIGRTMILYRPSMTKLKAEEEKKKQAQRNAWRRQQAFRPSSENRGLVPRERGHGRRGSSRFSNPA